MKGSTRNIALATALALCLAVQAKAEGSASQKDRLDRIAKKLSVVSGIRPRLLVTDEKAPRAWVMPDATIVVTSGLIQASRSDDELAFVLGHETAHIMNRDHLGHESPSIANPSRSAGLLGEITADLMAARLVAGAGYDPRASIDMLTRLAGSSDAPLEGRISLLRDFVSLKPR